MKPLNFTPLFSSLLAFSLLAAQPAMAAEWLFSDSLSQNRQAPISQYYYVAKGESWSNVSYSASYNTDKNVYLVVHYDDKPIYRATLSNAGMLNFNLPVSNSGFHRLDFIVQPNEPLNSSNLCLEEPLQSTSFEQAKLSYQPVRSALLLSDLPDALYNPKQNSKVPLKAAVLYSAQNIKEGSSVARLLSSWEQSRPIQWLNGQEAETPVDFKLILQQDSQLKAPALSLSVQNNVPALSIQYGTDKQLENAVNALLNSDYLTQLQAASATLPDNISSPRWAVNKRFNNLADLGVQDFRLGQSKQEFSLNFPSVWQPIDILQGQIALRSQSGLLEGSAMTAWINDALAGSIKLADLASDPVDRQFNIFSAEIGDTPHFNLAIENTVLANSKCLPNVQGSVWVNAEKSTLNLPYNLKQGVISLSSVLSTHPSIAVNEHPSSSSMAATAMQTAKKMLLTEAPVPLSLTRFDPAHPQSINIRVNPDIYRQQVQMHLDTLYAPTSAHGFFAIYQNGRFNLITDDAVGAETFNRLWPKIQDQIPDNAAKIFVSAEGNVYVLKKIVLQPKSEPIIEQSNTFVAIVIVSALIVLFALFSVWRKRKNENKTE